MSNDLKLIGLSVGLGLYCGRLAVNFNLKNAAFKDRTIDCLPVISEISNLWQLGTKILNPNYYNQLAQTTDHFYKVIDLKSKTRCAIQSFVPIIAALAAGLFYRSIKVGALGLLIGEGLVGAAGILWDNCTAWNKRAAMMAVIRRPWLIDRPQHLLPPPVGEFALRHPLPTERLPDELKNDIDVQKAALLHYPYSIRNHGFGWGSITDRGIADIVISNCHRCDLTIAFHKLHPDLRPDYFARAFSRGMSFTYLHEDTFENQFQMIPRRVHNEDCGGFGIDEYLSGSIDEAQRMSWFSNEILTIPQERLRDVLEALIDKSASLDLATIEAKFFMVLNNPQYLRTLRFSECALLLHYVQYDEVLNAKWNALAPDAFKIELRERSSEPDSEFNRTLFEFGHLPEWDN